MPINTWQRSSHEAGIRAVQQSQAQEKTIVTERSSWNSTRLIFFKDKIIPK